MDGFECLNHDPLSVNSSQRSSLQRKVLLSIVEAKLRILCCSKLMGPVHSSMYHGSLSEKAVIEIKSYFELNFEM